MPFGETKVYFDGSHYIAIPHTERKIKYRPKSIEETITVAERKDESDKIAEPLTADKSDETDGTDKVVTEDVISAETLTAATRTMTRKELFDELYREYIDLPVRERKLRIMYEMERYFDTVEELKHYVELGFERKYRNIVSRRIRMTRKANLAGFNYFCTFTYSDALHSEETFKKKLKNKLSLLAYRQGWKYMGVWERSPENKRLHFHGLFAIPEGKMIGSLERHDDYSVKLGRVQTTYQNTYFNERFGRSDFEEIITGTNLGEALAYLMKYIEKTGERIVYSKGLYQYFVSDIMDADVACRIGQEDKKLLLFDDFKCWDEGLYMGKVSPEVIAKMRKCN